MDVCMCVCYISLYLKHLNSVTLGSLKVSGNLFCLYTVFFETLIPAFLTKIQIENKIVRYADLRNKVKKPFYKEVKISFSKIVQIFQNSIKK